MEVTLTEVAPKTRPIEVVRVETLVQPQTKLRPITSFVREMQKLSSPQKLRSPSKFKLKLQNRVVLHSKLHHNHLKKNEKKKAIRSKSKGSASATSSGSAGGPRFDFKGKSETFFSFRLKTLPINQTNTCYQDSNLNKDIDKDLVQGV